MLTCKGALVYCKEFPIFPSLENEELFWVGGGLGRGEQEGGVTHTALSVPQILKCKRQFKWSFPKALHMCNGNLPLFWLTAARFDNWLSGLNKFWWIPRRWAKGSNNVQALLVAEQLKENMHHLCPFPQSGGSIFGVNADLCGWLVTQGWAIT